ncbi:MAG TPA: alpha/beta fold hydrolase [Acidimicrobiales bacterium]|nr:alpha/beta fold hydrolase [Acidimicrobiales bacterium]
MTSPSSSADLFEWNGRSLHFETFGSGDDVVVLLHGLLLNTKLNRGFARRLAGDGRRVVLLDLLGHGQSDKPVHAAEYRFDTYVEQVIALLDHLGVEQATLGGVSLGANVSLLAAATHPERVRGLVVEMPVLEWAVPAAALTFVPLLLATHYARRPLVPLADLVRGLPRTGIDALDSLLDAASLPPDVISAILHGILVGPIAPTFDARAALEIPVLVIGHRADLIHPFSDAENLSRQVPGARLVRGVLPFGMRFFPRRMLGEIEAFLDDIAAGSRGTVGA